MKAILATFRSRLADKVVGLRESASYLKSDDIVDDDACDTVTTVAQDIAAAFNELAPVIGLEPNRGAGGQRTVPVPAGVKREFASL